MWSCVKVSVFKSNFNCIINDYLQAVFIEDVCLWYSVQYFINWFWLVLIIIKKMNAIPNSVKYDYPLIIYILKSKTSNTHDKYYLVINYLILDFKSHVYFYIKIPYPYFLCNLYYPFLFYYDCIHSCWFWKILQREKKLFTFIILL